MCSVIFFFSLIKPPVREHGQDTSHNIKSLVFSVFFFIISFIFLCVWKNDHKVWAEKKPTGQHLILGIKFLFRFLLFKTEHQRICWEG